ncbi:DUF885 family protein [Sorangium sp. So ce1078]
MAGPRPSSGAQLGAAARANVIAFTEGWGLYSERLADEMGLYSSDLDRLGMLSADAWRACRLVVDTGIHAKGWSRSQAVSYMTENTFLDETVVANEIDRYITWPGQALAWPRHAAIRDMSRCSP